MAPLLKKNLIETNNIIIDSKSGYSGAGKKFDLNNIKNKKNFNFYNYNTNQHRHICEIDQELNKYSQSKLYFSFNPHILPIYRGMMSTIYCDLTKGTKLSDVHRVLEEYTLDLPFVKLLDEDKQGDFFAVQNTNDCLIKLYGYQNNNKIIIVSLIDNLIKGAAGQAVQCFNIMNNLNETISLLEK